MDVGQHQLQLQHQQNQTRQYFMVNNFFQFADGKSSIIGYRLINQ